HQKVLPESDRKCSATGPRLSAGKKVKAPTIRITATSRPVNSSPWVGKVPGLSGTVFLPLIEPATASTGMIIRNRPASMARPMVVFHQGVLVVRPAKAERISVSPWGPALFRELVP